MNITIRLEIVDYNSTIAKIEMFQKAETSVGTIEFPNATLWFNIQQTKYAVENQTLTGTTDATVQYNGMGTKNCKVYQYQSEGTTMKLYVDKEIGWIMKIAFNSETGNVDLNLTDTNISALK